MAKKKTDEPVPDDAKPEKDAKAKDRPTLKNIGSFVRNTIGMVEKRHNDLKSLDPEEKWTVIKKKVSGPPYKHCDDYGWMVQVIKFSYIQFFLSIVTAVVVWIFVFGSYTRPAYMAKADGGIRMQLDEYRDTDLADLNEVFTWLFDLLQNVNLISLDPKVHFRSYLTQMSPDIFERMLNKRNSGLEDIKRGQLFFSLHITDAIRVYMNPEDERITVYVKGYIVRAAKNAGSVGVSGRKFNPLVILPYRAEAVVRRDFPTKLNPTGLYLERLTEKMGNDSLEWIKELGVEPKQGDPLVVQPPKEEAEK